MKQAKKAIPFVWLDMEMTGLDPEKEHVLEIATIVTDSNLKILDEGPSLIIHQPPRVLKEMEPWSAKQHGKSGLLDEVKQSKVSVKAAEKKTLQFLKMYCSPGQSPLCGSVVYHDRRFLIRYMPKLHRFLHYHHIDVATIKDLVRRWYPTTQHEFKKKEAHRAYDDTLESIEELRFYRTHYFK